LPSRWIAPPANAFTSGAWEGQANNDEDGTFRDCTMTADYANGITLASIISRDFGWGRPPATLPMPTALSCIGAVLRSFK